MKRYLFILGDVLMIAILTVIGFFTHGEAGLSFVPRMGTTFFPALISWFLFAPWLGVFDLQVAKNPKLLWRVPLAMLLAAPLAVILRAALLGVDASPLFALILGSSNALGVTAWRVLYFFYLKRTP